MNLATAKKWIQLCLIDTDAAYGSTVFDEWLIVWMGAGHRDIVQYSGPRFEKANDFQRDMQPLKTSIQGKQYHIGDLEFARDGEGTYFDMLLMAGTDVFVIFNNTEKSLAEISSNIEWTEAQIPLAKLGEQFHTDPVTLP